MQTIKDYLPPSLVICKGNCPICGKKLEEDDSIFACRDCMRKDREIREQQTQAKEKTTLQETRQTLRKM